MNENPIFSYTKRDYEGSRKEGMASIPILSKGMWTDLNAGDPGVVLLDHMYAIADLCNYYLDHQALEMFISTAKERINLLRLAQNVCYKTRAAKGASVDVRMYVKTDEAFNTTVTVPKGTLLEPTSKGVIYRTDEDCIMTDANFGYDVPCTQGEVVNETYTGTGISSVIHYHTDEVQVYQDQFYTLQGTGVDIDTISIIDKAGNLWEPVDFIAFVENPDKVYQIIVNADSSVTIKFGNGVRGYNPTPSDVLTITYINTMGDQGRVGEKEILGTLHIVGSDANQYNVAYYNMYPSSGGSYGESDEELKRNIMTSAKTIQRAVTREDFEHLALSIDGVKEVKVCDIHTTPDLCLYHEVKIYILADDTSDTSNSLINKVRNYLRERSIPPTNVLVYAPNKVGIDLTVTARQKPYLPIGGEDPRDELENCINDYFNTELKIGEPFNPLELSNYIMNHTVTIATVTSITPSTAVDVGDTGIPSLNTLTINVG